MEIIRNRTITADEWRYELEPVEELPTANIAPGDVIVSMQRWLSDHEQLLLARGTRIGVVLSPGDNLQALIDCELHELWLVAIEFPTFAEGRGYSQARLLRSRHDYHGGIRAIGDVSRDRIAFMERCGFNELELSAGQSAGDALDAFAEIAAVYQPAADAMPTLARIRGYRAHSESLGAASNAACNRRSRVRDSQNIAKLKINTTMDHLPLFMDVSDRQVLMVGGGDAAARKVSLLLRANARVLVVAPWLCEALAQLRAQERIEHDPQPFCAGHLHDPCIAFAASEDDALNTRVSKLANSARIPVNVVDSPHLCSFIMPAIVDRSPLIVAVSSAGTSPVLTTMIRARIEAMLEPGIGRVARWAGRWRERVMARIESARARRQWWESVLNGPLAATLAREHESQGSESWADAQLQCLLDAQDGSPLVGRVALLQVEAGAVDLLTLRAARLLREADVIVHERGLADEVLEIARRDAVRIDVSRRRHNRRLSPKCIIELLTQLAGEGRRVVRLNDRSSLAMETTENEAAALAAAGVDCDLVPGVSRAALAPPTQAAAA